MNKTTPNITEEHIVAWLDGEVTPTADFDRSLKSNPELATAASEYAALSAAFSTSRSDKRFALPVAVDSRVRASLATEISRSRKTVRMPERAPLAAPVPSTTTIVRTKTLWVRRSAYAMALVVMAMFGWFIGHNGETTVQTAANVPATGTTTTPTVTTAPTPSQVADNVSTTTTTAPATEQHTAATSRVHASPVANVQNQVISNAPAPATAVNVTPKQNTPVAEDNDPAAIMASHRYAKVIKATQAVVITSQDQL